MEILLRLTILIGLLFVYSVKASFLLLGILSGLLLVEGTYEGLVLSGHWVTLLSGWGIGGGLDLGQGGGVSVDGLVRLVWV